jgi:putative chitinase
MIVTITDLMQIMPQAAHWRIEGFIGGINDAFSEFDINTPMRAAQFLAQIACESIQLTYTAELASGIRYEGRADLGNTMPGDGQRFKGRGLIQVTGRANYAACAKALGLPLLDHPELLELPIYAAQSAGWFWRSHGCNEIADTGDVKAVTRRVNGGYNNLSDRIAFFDRARKVLL